MLRLGAHPLQALDGLLHRGQLVADQLLRARFGDRGEIPFDVLLSHRFAEQRVGRLRAARRPRLHLRHAGELRLVEREPRILERPREPRRRGGDQVPGEVRAPGGDRRIRKLAVDRLEELRLLDVEVAARQLRLVEVSRPVEVRRELPQLGEGDHVIGVLRIAQRDVVE